MGQGGVGDSVGLVAFDADDTLWDCQGAFCAVEHALAKLLSPYADADEVLRVLATAEYDHERIWRLSSIGDLVEG